MSIKAKPFWEEFNNYANDRDDANNRDGEKLNFDLSNPGDSKAKNPSSYIIEMDAPCRLIYFTIRISVQKNTLTCKIRFGQEKIRVGQSIATNFYKAKEINFFDSLKLIEEEVKSELSKYIADENSERVEYDAEGKKPTIHLTRRVDAVLDIDKRDQYFEWLYTNGLLFKKVFGEYYIKFINKKA